MKTVKVNASKEYCVHIGKGLLPSLGKFCSKVIKPCKCAIISDSNVWPIYGSIAQTSLENEGFAVISYVFPAGEASKNGSTYLSVLNFLSENQMTRSDCLIALGGGVVGDLTGFAAATYLRGVHYIQIPTTLLAAVDSSVGGKTAIDLDAGKNLAGAFYQPSLVLCDTDTLTTLPAPVFRDGCAEVIKYGILYDRVLFSHLEEFGLDFHREEVITRCVALKRDVVAQDEFDRGARMKLNLGHTIGHGVEAASNFSVSHGAAVAIGTAIVARASACTDAGRIVHLLQKFSLPTHTEYSADTLYTFTLSDKKRSGSTLNLILPRSIGDCIISHTDIRHLKSFIQAGL